MSGHIPRPVRLIALVATLLVSGVGISVPANHVRIIVFSAPNSLAPQGSHWYYQLDWATERKCWVPVRAFRQPAQLAAASTTSRGRASASDASSVRAGTLRCSAKRTGRKYRAVIDRGTRCRRTKLTAVNAEAAGPAPAAPVASPAPAPATVKGLEPIAIPTGDPSGSVSGDAERISSSKPTKNAGITIFPILALGLAVVGILSRVVIKTVAARRVSPRASTIRDQHASVDERREFHSLISVVSKSGLFRAEGGFGFPGIAHQISKRRDKLAQLRQVLDRLLQHEPREGRDLAMTGAG